MIETKLLGEQENSIQEFTLHLYSSRVLADRLNAPLGQISADVLNLEDELLILLQKKADGLLQDIYMEWLPSSIDKRLEAAVSVQSKLDEVHAIVFGLPLFRQLNLDKEKYRSMMINASENQALFVKLQNPGSPEHQIFMGYILKLTGMAAELITFKLYISLMLDHYFEGLKKRNSEHYAAGVYRFFSDADAQREISQQLPHAPPYQFSQARGVMIEYTTMPDPTDAEKYIVAERIVFHSMASFLHVDFFRGLMHGNTPRRCHNCGRFFLLATGYDTRYCDRIAPGETEKTCQVVGAHNKESQAEKTPAQKAYKKAYNRLQKRKLRNSLSVDDWNKKVALAQGYRDQANRGEITIEKLTALLYQL